MNRAEKRRQRKLAEKAPKKAKPGQETIPSPEQQTLTVQQTLDLALQHHTAGRLPEAERIFQQILQADPNQPVALHLLGVIDHQAGKSDTAVNLITKAVIIKPDLSEAHNNRGISLQDLGKLDEADAKPHGNSDGKVSYGELRTYLKDTMTYSARRYYGRDQKAQIVRGGVGGELSPPPTLNPPKSATLMPLCIGCSSFLSFSCPYSWGTLCSLLISRRGWMHIIRKTMRLL